MRIFNELRKYDGLASDTFKLILSSDISDENKLSEIKLIMLKMFDLFDRNDEEIAELDWLYSLLPERVEARERVLVFNPDIIIGLN